MRLGMYLQLSSVLLVQHFQTFLTLPEISNLNDLSTAKGGQKSEFHMESTAQHTLSLGFSAFTGFPLAFFGVRVPASSAFFCSRRVCKGLLDIVAALQGLPVTEFD